MSIEEPFDGEGTTYTVVRPEDEQKVSEARQYVDKICKILGVWTEDQKQAITKKIEDFLQNRTWVAPDEDKSFIDVEEKAKGFHVVTSITELQKLFGGEKKGNIAVKIFVSLYGEVVDVYKSLLVECEQNKDSEALEINKFAQFLKELISIRSPVKDINDLYKKLGKDQGSNKTLTKAGQQKIQKIFEIIFFYVIVSQFVLEQLRSADVTSFKGKVFQILNAKLMEYLEVLDSIVTPNEKESFDKFKLSLSQISIDKDTNIMKEVLERLKQQKIDVPFSKKGIHWLWFLLLICIIIVIFQAYVFLA